jgi:hypothetical protein
MKDKDKEIIWRYEASTKTIRSVPENYWIATMDSWDGAVDHEANAKLIAAAPELLKALEWLVEDADDRGELAGDDGKLYADWKNALAAIKKAKG